MDVLVCGGHGWLPMNETCRYLTLAALDIAHSRQHLSCLLLGGEPALNAMARQWALNHGVDTRPADPCAPASASIAFPREAVEGEEIAVVAALAPATPLCWRPYGVDAPIDQLEALDRVQPFPQDWPDSGGENTLELRFCVIDCNGHLRGDFEKPEQARQYLASPPHHMAHLVRAGARVKPFAGLSEAALERALWKHTRQDLPGQRQRMAA